MRSHHAEDSFRTVTASGAPGARPDPGVPAGPHTPTVAGTPGALRLLAEPEPLPEIAVQIAYAAERALFAPTDDERGDGLADLFALSNGVAERDARRLTGQAAVRHARRTRSSVFLIGSTAAGQVSALETTPDDADGFLDSFPGDADAIIVYANLSEVLR